MQLEIKSVEGKKYQRSYAQGKSAILENCFIYQQKTAYTNTYVSAKIK